MLSRYRYAERRIPLAADAVTTLAALARDRPGAQVGYENRGTVSWAENAWATVELHDGGARLITEDRETEFAGKPLDVVGKALAAAGIADWRAYGWAAFELAHVLHDTASASGPLACLMIPRAEVRLDGASALVRAATESEVDELAERLAVAIAPETPADARVPADLDHDAAAYREMVAAAVGDIRAGKLDKVILSRVVPVEGDLDLAATYLAGRRGNDPARSYLLRLGGWEAAGFSPEIVARVTADGRARTQPLAGTRALDGDALDVARRAELYRDAKEVFEHAISVRLAAAELDEVCAPDSVGVSEFMSVRERGSVQHLGSDVAGDLADGKTAWDALTALFPAVTASGIPKAAACEAIGRLEPGPRGLYSGAVLTADADGSLDAALVLRSVFRYEGRTWLRAGAGIVAQSTPDRELEETREKLRSVSRFLVPALAPAVLP
ncbi:salicylate synthase [Amycolatopsis orientalis]|uniref:salicylate synthase n=1 Tax=Amycolatopsis orientalis TaxID=31958 RepID=UPI0003FFAFCD|nr:salicylate synthase [Amycolatopsis orientalis]